jgi:phosphoribosylamine--glycine ligase
MNANKQKILIIGGGGREHAVGWKVKQSSRCGELYFAPGNAGTAELGSNVALEATDILGLIEFAKANAIDVTLALPDDPLSLGIVDAFRAVNLRIFGPTQEASQLESSKAFAKHFMETHNLPTARFKTWTSYPGAEEYVNETQNFPLVIKASGLALGKGVVICQDVAEAHQVLNDMLIAKTFGDAGSVVVIEEFMTGPEISVHAFSDGLTYKLFPISQDHKKIGDDDTGPNTGGMGTITPLPFVDQDLIDTIEATIVAPTFEAMKASSTPFEGVLYPGLMLTPAGPKILEYNARFGDPETQMYMRLLETDLLDIVEACIDKKLHEIDIKWSTMAACNIVLASGGYPGKYEKGKAISGIRDAQADPSIIVFHAGTKLQDGTLVTNGGRVLGISAVGATFQDALKKAYDAVAKISFEGMQYRTDIGKKALEQ